MTDLLQRALADAQQPVFDEVGPSLIARMLFGRRPARSARNPLRDGAGYSSSAALLLSAASAWAYSDGETLDEMLEICGMTNARSSLFSVVNGALFVDAQAFLVRSDETRVGVLVFRGTEIGGVTLTDVFTDINTETVPYPDSAGSSVHGGFHRSFKYLWRKLVPELETAADGIDHLYIAGHSLGGALAVLATCELVDGTTFTSDEAREKLWSSFRGLYTFGQPMVGDSAFAEHFDEAMGAITYRHVFQYDVVPRLPPRTTGDFAHFGREYFGTSGVPWSRRDVPLRQAWAASLAIPVALLAFVVRQLPAGRRLSLPVSLSDHMPQNYVDCSKLANAITTYP